MSKKEESMVECLLNSPFPEYWTKEQRELWNAINKRKYDDMIAKGLKPKREDFYGC